MGFMDVSGWYARVSLGNVREAFGTEEPLLWP